MATRKYSYPAVSLRSRRSLFQGRAIKVLPEDHDWNRAEEYLESLIEWLAGYTDESEVRKAIECYSIKGSEEQTEFFLGAILGDEY